MDCEQALALLLADMDGEIQADERARLAAHVKECAACRTSSQAFRLQDAELRRLFAPRRQAAEAVAQRVIARLPVYPAWPRRRLPWLPILVSAAAGFLLAVLVFRPWQNNSRGNQAEIQANKQVPGTRDGFEIRPGTAVESEPVLLAVASHDVEFLPPDQHGWRAINTGTRIPLGSRVRTGPEVRCEFTLADGSEVRLNKETELAFAAGRQIAMVRGQVLARVAHAPAAFRVEIPDATITALSTEFDVLCRPADSVLTVLQGATKVEGKGTGQVVQTGETATIVHGEIIHKRQVENLLQIKSWTNEILMLKGRNNKELAERVNDLLAQLGHSKTEFLEEQEIRGLGDHCVLPLTRFIQSDRSRVDEPRRHMAARILSDLAQPWSIPDLIALLGDPDPEIRYNAAKALKRLTQQTFGHQPEAWRTLTPYACEDARRQWQAWWRENQQRYPRALDAQDVEAGSSKVPSNK